MPTTLQIENADVLTASQALRLLAAIRASEYFRENRAAYPDIDATIKARVNRKKTLSGATNASPIVVTSTAHGFSDDEVITVQGVLGNTAANGVWLIANKTADTFELQGSTGNGAYTSGGEILDLVSQHLSAIADALDLVGDGTVGLKGGSKGVDYSQVRDREALVAEALDALYDVEDAGAIVAVGQRDYPERFCPVCNCKYYTVVCSCVSIYA
jgi:hypothetical protein